jgi:hypothetical protein
LGEGECWFLIPNCNGWHRRAQSVPDTIPLRNTFADSQQGRDQPLACKDGFSVADLCRRWRVGADKIHSFRRAGELIGINLAANMSIRPLWRFTRQTATGH